MDNEEYHARWIGNEIKLGIGFEHFVFITNEKQHKRKSVTITTDEFGRWLVTDDETEERISIKEAYRKIHLRLAP